MRGVGGLAQGLGIWYPQGGGLYTRCPGRCSSESVGTLLGLSAPFCPGHAVPEARLCPLALCLGLCFAPSHYASGSVLFCSVTLGAGPLSLVHHSPSPEDLRPPLLTQDSAILTPDRLLEDETGVQDETHKALKQFAKEGLRTLVMAERYLSAEYWEEWDVQFREAHHSPPDERASRLEHIADEVERHMDLLGATAVEDRMQVLMWQRPGGGGVKAS